MASDDDKLFTDALRQYWWVGAVIGVGLMLWLSVANYAYAHDHLRADLNEWFDSLRSGKGDQCCSDADGALVKNADWETVRGADGIAHYRVRIGGKWIDVPDSAVIKQPNLYGQTVVWGSRSWYEGEGHYNIRCFIAGVMM